jgi:hypothetical protein
LKPIFTVHAGEFLVGCEIEKKNLKVWIPAKDTGIDLLVSNKNNTKTVSLQVKLSRDYLVTNKNKKDAVFLGELRASGWWTPNREKIEKSVAQYWVFVLVRADNRSPDFIIIKPKDLLQRLKKIHGNTVKKFHIYFCVTRGIKQKEKCYEIRDLNPEDKLKIAKNEFNDDSRDFTAYLNNWTPIKVLNG